MKKPKNLQDYFDNAWEWFVVFGNGPSVRTFTENGVTVTYSQYRSPDGGRCPIGASILDEDYYSISREDAEDTPFFTVLGSLGYQIAGIQDQLAELLACHDDLIKALSPIPEDFAELIKKNLEDFADRHELVIPG